MTLALALQTDRTRFALALTLPTYRPSIMLAVILALCLAVAGLAVDILLFPAGPVGSVAMWPAAISAGICLGLAALEWRKML